MDNEKYADFDVVELEFYQRDRGVVRCMAVTQFTCLSYNDKVGGPAVSAVIPNDTIQIIPVPEDAIDELQSRLMNPDDGELVELMPYQNADAFLDIGAPTPQQTADGCWY